MLIDNFEQQFVNCVLNVQNMQKSAQNQIVLIPQKMSSSKFSVVSLFLNMLYGKKRKPRNNGNRQKAF